MITFIGTPSTPGRLTSSPKKRWKIPGGKEPVCPDEPQNGLRKLTEGLKTHPPHLDPSILPAPCWRALQTTPRCSEKKRDYLLDTGLISCYVIIMNQSESFLTFFLTDNFSTCFLTCFKALGWKTWAIASSAVISFGCFFIFFMEVSYGS